MTDHSARLDEGEPEPVAPAEGVASSYDLDALRLLRLTHLRRHLRTLYGYELLALPLWLIYTYVMTEVVYGDDRNLEGFWRINDEIVPGLFVILIAFGVTFVLLLSTRWFGRAGRVAAKLVPIVGRAAIPRVPDRTKSGHAVVARLGRKGYVRPAILGAALIPALLLVIGVTTSWPAWEANHGHGGQVVTIGKDASLAYSKDSGVRGAGRDYFLNTPLGTAIAESGEPSDGQRWTVTRGYSGVRAYLVGGHDYLAALLIGAMGLFFLLGVVLWQIAVIQSERRRRRAAGHPDLAADVAALAGGGRPELRAGRTHLGVLGLRPLAGRAPRRLLRRRYLTSGAAGVLTAGGLTALLVVQQVGLLTGPPEHRDVHLPYIAAAGWNPKAEAHYGDLDYVEKALRRDASYAHILHAGEFSAPRKLDVDRAAHGDSAATLPTADVTITRIGSTDPYALVSAWHARQQHAFGGSDVPGLPAGWSGLHDTDPSDGITTNTVDVMGAADGVCVEIHIIDSYTSADDKDERVSSSVLTSWVRSLASAFANASLHRVDQDTVRPKHL